MASSTLLFFLCSILLQFVAPTIAQQKVLNEICLDKNGNYSANSAYKANLDRLLSSITKANINNGFYNASEGKSGDDRVNAMVLCRGDVKPDSCKSCVKNSTQELPKRCPNQIESFIWYDACMLRYSNRYFFGNMEFGPYFYMYNVNNVTNADQFNKAVKGLLDDLKGKAAKGGSLRKFATGTTAIPKAQTIYALVQCTPDLSETKCSDCLTNATNLLPDCCVKRQGGRVISPSCNFRYEISRFYDDTTSNTPTPSPSPPSPKPKSPPSPSRPSPKPKSPPPPSRSSPKPKPPPPPSRPSLNPKSPT